MPVQKTVTYELYQFDELSDKAKEKALSWLSETNYDDFDLTWENATEDAESIGLKLTGCDSERGQAFYPEGEFKTDALSTAESILKDHGEICETYKTAKTYLDERDANIKNVTDENEISDWLEEHDSEFLKSLLQDYGRIIRKDMEYRSSREYLEEQINANEYTFDENGNRKD